MEWERGEPPQTPIQMPGYFGGVYVGGVMTGLVWDPESRPFICSDNPCGRLNTEQRKIIIEIIINPNVLHA